MKKVYIPISASIELLDTTDVLRTSSSTYVSNNEQYVKAGSDFFTALEELNHS